MYIDLAGEFRITASCSVNIVLDVSSLVTPTMQMAVTICIVEKNIFYLTIAFELLFRNQSRVPD